MEKGFSRRDFLKFGAAGAAGAAAISLAGCSPATSGEGAGTQAAEGVINSSEAVIKLTDAMPKWSFMVAPEPISDDKITETIENDIIVVGAGMAGLTTAVAAAEKGRERHPVFGLERSHFSWRLELRT